MADLLCALKEETARAVGASADRQGEGQSAGVGEELHLAPATVHRLLSRRGLMDKKLEQPDQQGPAPLRLREGGRAVDERRDARPRGDGRTGASARRYLLALLDDATRVMPYAAFALSGKHGGLPAGARAGDPAPRHPQAALRRQRRRLPLAPPCARLREARHHPHPRAAVPAARQGQDGALVSHGAHAAPADARPRPTRTRSTRSTALWAWVEGEYHQSPHRGLDGETPLDRWAMSAARHPPRRSRRAISTSSSSSSRSARSQRDRTVSLNGVVYEVDASLVGETVTLRFDPARAPAAPVEVWHARGARSSRPSRVDALRQLLRQARPHRRRRSSPIAGSTTRPRGCRCATSTPRKED